MILHIACADLIEDRQDAYPMRAAIFSFSLYLAPVRRKLAQVK